MLATFTDISPRIIRDGQGIVKAVSFHSVGNGSVEFGVEIASYQSSGKTTYQAYSSDGEIEYYDPRSKKLKSLTFVPSPFTCDLNNLEHWEKVLK